ncbi:hypothetical protein OQA88_5710 [Cercophora sp. LCS_1]
MDEMDYMRSTDPSLSQGHRPSTQGCPYLRSDHGGHLVNLPNPHGQSHHAHQQQHGLHAPGHPGPGMMLPSGRLSHHYDPVHAASGASNWYSPPNAPYHWPAPLSLPHSHPQGQTHPHLHPQLPHVRSLGPGSEPYYAGVGGGSAPSAGAPGTGPGPIQPGLLHQLSPHHESFGGPQYPSFPVFRGHNISLHEHPHRFGATSSSSQNTIHSHPSHPSHQQQQQQQQQHSQQSSQSQPAQHQPQQQAPLTANRSTASQTGPLRGISLPALNPATLVPAPLPQPTMSSSSSGESSPDAPSASRDSSLFGPHDASVSSRTRSSGNGNSNMPPLSSVPLPPRSSLFGGPEPSRPEATSSDPEPTSATQAPPALLSADRRRSHNTRVRPGRAPVSDYDSDEEIADLVDSENEALSFLEQFTGNPALRTAEAEEIRIRAHQVLRGQMSNKRVASKKALSQLQTVDVNSLEESERTCVICYNEFGVENPEGVNEAPLRLPNCKHIFGDHCIKKWFEESDSCPYCRDKVHSEPALAANSRALHQFIQQYHAGNHVPRYHPNRVDTRPLPTDPPLSRTMGNHRPDDSRFENSPPRIWQTGERRSPPSEGMESRRRTRARHGSFRGSQSTNSAANRQNAQAGANPANPPSLQQSPARDRASASGDFHWQRFLDVRQPLTHNSGRPFMPSLAPHRQYSYGAGIGRHHGIPSLQPVEPMGLNPPMPPTQMGMGFGALMGSDDDQRHSMLSAGIPAALPSDIGQLPGPSQIVPFAQQLPPVGALDAPGFQGSSNMHPTGHASDNGSWMQQ